MFSQNNGFASARQEKFPAMTDPYQTCRYRVARREIAYLRFIVEGYEGLLFLRTLDAAAGLVEFAWPASRATEAATLLAALTEETGLQAIGAAPEGSSGWL